ncbi:MAG: hypothetical protein AB2A00_01305 [Myxococcota bacterium]
MEKPVEELRFGKHVLQYFGQKIFVIAYDGDVNEAEAKTLMDFINARDKDPVVGFYVTEMSKMGKFTPEARKVIGSSNNQSLKDLYLCMVNASVVTRAALMLVLTAARLTSSTNTHMKSFNNVEDALNYCRATAKEKGVA